MDFGEVACKKNQRQNHDATNKGSTTESYIHDKYAIPAAILSFFIVT